MSEVAKERLVRALEGLVDAMVLLDVPVKRDRPRGWVAEMDTFVYLLYLTLSSTLV